MSKIFVCAAVIIGATAAIYPGAIEPLSHGFHTAHVWASLVVGVYHAAETVGHVFQGNKG